MRRIGLQRPCIHGTGNQSITMTAWACALAALAIALPAAAAAQPAQIESASARAEDPPVTQAVARDGTISVDGVLDEAAWARAQPITELRQYQPSEGEPASLPTEIRILYDEHALYIGARMGDPMGRDGVRAPLTRRDQLLDGSGDNGAFNSLTSDKLVVMLDPYHNHLDEVLFEVNPAGVRDDAMNGDPSWDPIWEAAAHVDSGGWTAEIRIPYSQLRFSRDVEQGWGMQLWRYVDRLNERDMWSFWRRNASGGPPFYGHLDGIRVVDRPRQLELLPYVVSGAHFSPAAPGDPYHDGREARLSVGGDLKYLITSNLTLDATVNPDFGQVEVDPASLNLSAFETFYDEKRPFFVAGRSAFSFGGMRCQFCSNTSSLSVLYSRRIGRPPQLNDYVNGIATYADTPDDASILGAAKITGRTSQGYTIGFLDAVTRERTARYVTGDGANRQQRDQLVEPLSNYMVARVKKELNGGATTIGGIVTSTMRRLDGDSVATSMLRSHAEVVGLDWRHTWHDRTYSWMGSTAVSNVAGSASAIERTQRSSARYFQRPGRSVASDGLFDAAYDPTATSLRGYGLYTRVAKESGDWLWETAQNWRSPGFEVNDLAYLSRTDFKWMNVNLTRQWVRPTPWYRNIITILGAQQQFDYDGQRTDAELQAYYGMEFPNYWRLRTFAMYHPSVYDNWATRGGPTVRTDGYRFGHFQLSTDARRTAVFDLTLEGSTGIRADTRSWSIQPGMAIKPASNVFIQLAPNYSYDEGSAQYVTAVPDPTAVAFDGVRYVFGAIRTRTLSLDTRINWTFTPTLTLQLFAQPFLASGEYERFREFAAPRDSRKVDYGSDAGWIERDDATARYTVDPDGTGPAQSFSFADPDFTYRSLRGTAVLRWEYRPGSTLFLVWAQTRDHSGSSGEFHLGDGLDHLFGRRPDNVFMVKASYWFNP